MQRSDVRTACLYIFMALHSSEHVLRMFNANMMVVRKNTTDDKPNDDMFNNNLMKKVLIQNIDVDLHRAQTISREMKKKKITTKQKQQAQCTYGMKLRRSVWHF